MRDPARAWFYGKLILDMIIAFLLLDFALFVSVFVYLSVHAHMRINRWKIYAYIGIYRYTSMCTIVHASAGVCARAFYYSFHIQTCTETIIRFRPRKKL